MDLSWITAPLIIALVALWLAYSNYRRNNFAIIRVRDCACSYTQSIHENRGQPFYHFRLVIQNLGIPLHNLRMSLSFSGKDGAGRLTFPLKASEESALREGEFAKGMITDFSLKSFQL